MTFYLNMTGKICLVRTDITIILQRRIRRQNIIYGSEWYTFTISLNSECGVVTISTQTFFDNFF